MPNASKESWELPGAWSSQWEEKLEQHAHGNHHQVQKVNSKAIGDHREGHSTQGQPHVAQEGGGAESLGLQHQPTAATGSHTVPRKSHCLTLCPPRRLPSTAQNIFNREENKVTA